MSLRNNKGSSLIGLLLVVVLSNSHAEPFSIRNLNPLLTGFELPPALPAQFDSATSIDAGYAIGNISLDQTIDKERAAADAEVHRWSVNLFHRINSNWQLNVEIPYQKTSGGSLDAFIEHFHNTFSLPNGNRAGWPRNRLLVDYHSGNQSLFHLDKRASGLADTAIRAGWQFDHNDSHSGALWFSVKLPAGNAASLTGSGSVDAAISASLQQRLDRFHFFQQMSLSWFGKAKRLATLQKHTAWSGVVGADWSWTDAINVVAQIESHSAVYDSRIKMLGTATQLVIGPQYHSGHWLASLSIAEDIAVDTAPDVQFQFNLARRF